MRKLMLLAAMAVGYVLGARAGRERYDQIMGALRGLANDPRVQEQAHRAVDLAKEQAPAVADKVSAAASSAASKVTASNGSDRPHRMAGPQGDLP